MPGGAMLEQALALARRGFHVFPLVEGSKLPAIVRWQDRATRDEATIRAWWTCPVSGFEQPYNIGLCTTRYGDDKALIAVDVDNKGDKRGDQEIIRLEADGKDFPRTYEQTTPTGGRHFVYRCAQAVKQGTNVLGSGLDLRSRGGFIVGSGSAVPAGRYEHADHEMVDAPRWLIDACGRAPGRKTSSSTKPIVNIGVDNALRRARHYLFNEALVAVQGRGGDETTYKVAARLKDFGLPEHAALIEMMHWNELCDPPWGADELATKVANAYHYGQSPPGSAAPETDFALVAKPRHLSTSTEVLQHPFAELNRAYAFVLAGGGHHVLWETTGSDGRFRLEHLSEPSFHRAHAARVMQVGEKVEPVTRLWMSSPDRRSYRGLCFMPGHEAPPGWYNLWRGFAVSPAGDKDEISPEGDWAVAAWFEHLERNVCGGSKHLACWLTAYFAHLVQRPDEKPLVALVLRGGKGVGKNALVELGPHGILGAHSMIVTDRRYLVGNFNGHFENLLLITFDEAFWSGDKQAEGILKGLVTGAAHVIEHKGKEPYTIENRCRVVIIGNEEWLVPASHDERRFAVFDVGEGRKNDREFFKRMELGMKAGGFELLLKRLLMVDISEVDINAAPATAGLMDQKTATMDPFYQWWLDCLTEGWLIGSDLGAGTWPGEVEKDRFRNALSRYLRERNIRVRMPDERAIGKCLKRCASGASPVKKRDGTAYANVYRLRPLAEHRKEWELYIGHEVSWP